MFGDAELSEGFGFGPAAQVTNMSRASVPNGRLHVVGATNGECPVSERSSGRNVRGPEAHLLRGVNAPPCGRPLNLFRLGWPQRVGWRPTAPRTGRPKADVEGSLPESCLSPMNRFDPMEPASNSRSCRSMAGLKEAQ